MDGGDRLDAMAGLQRDPLCAQAERVLLQAARCAVQRGASLNGMALPSKVQQVAQLHAAVAKSSQFAPNSAPCAILESYDVQIRNKSPSGLSALGTNNNVKESPLVPNGNGPNDFDHEPNVRSPTFTQAEGVDVSVKSEPLAAV